MVDRDLDFAARGGRRRRKRIVCSEAKRGCESDLASDLLEMRLLGGTSSHGLVV